MEFLKQCASRLDSGEEAESVMTDMRLRYTTVRCLNVKTCLVRSLCKPSAAYTAAHARLLEMHPEHAEGLIREDRRDDEVRALLATLPARSPHNVAQLKVTRAQMIECKRLGARSALEKNRRRVRVCGTDLLAFARSAIQTPNTCRFADLALCIMLLTGRRTCEVLNGHSTFEPHGEHSLRFVGQAKKRRDDDGYIIPTLARAREVLEAMRHLRLQQSFVRRTNRETSLCYQSSLGRHLSGHPSWSQCRNVHALRGLYACMALRLFVWDGDESDAFVAMCILGHTGLHESLVYTPFHLGEDFANEPRLGNGVLTAPPVQ